MELIISKNGVKRSLTLPFKLCASPEVLQKLIDSLVKARDRSGGYGWYNISIVEPDYESEINQKPKEWEE